MYSPFLRVSWLPAGNLDQIEKDSNSNLVHKLRLIMFLTIQQVYHLVLQRGAQDLKVFYPLDGKSTLLHQQARGTSAMKGLLNALMNPRFNYRTIVLIVKPNHGKFIDIQGGETIYINKI
jgi:hypothetical protein